MADRDVKAMAESIQASVFESVAFTAPVHLSKAKVADGTPWKEAGIPGIPARVSQDIRGYYEIAALGLSDHIPAAWSGTNWFLDETEGGKAVLAARSAMRDAGAKQPVWFYMTPGDRQ